MKKGLFTIKENRNVADRTFEIVLEGDTSACVRGGQFADIGIPTKFLKRPLAVTRWDANTITLFYKTVGEGTEMLSKMKRGETLEVLTGLGNGFDTTACRKKALVVCGGLGASPVFSLVKQLKDEGKEVALILGFNRAVEIVLEEEYRALGIEPVIVTMDGSKGIKGLVTDAISALRPEYDYFYTCGPKIMMKAVCEALDGPGEASLEERMGCGCGICYGCTCHTKKGPRRVCADGPIFKKEEIEW